MADLTTQRRSPLAHLAAGTGSDRVRLAELPFHTMVSVRRDPLQLDGGAAGAVGRALGAPLPRVSGRVSEHGPHRILVLGPDEWLVVSDEEPGTVVEAVDGAVGDAHAAVVDVSASRTILELAGSAARAVLEKGCPVDLHPRAFRPGTAVTTTLARIPLILWQVRPDAYWLLPRSSFADHVARWLLDAMQEFGSPSAV
jgi:sarcosine oxidase subunit gamma